MKKIGVIGHFGFGKNLLNGQTVKTKIITKEIINQVGNDEVACLDTSGGKKKIISLTANTIQLMRKCENVIMMPAHNGVIFFSPILAILKKLCKTNIYYIVIGGWISEFVGKKKNLKKYLLKFDGIYVETSTMQKSMRKQGFDNIHLMPNCKELKILDEKELVYTYSEPLSVCTFSRVMKEKGIEDIIDAITRINEEAGRIVYILDIYGQIEDCYNQEFKKIISKAHEYIRYCGIVPYDKSTQILKNYFALIFPTRFYTEGVPGTIIDAYASGVPVISSRWESFDDVIDDGEVGYGYKFGDVSALTNLLVRMAQEPHLINNLKRNCINKALGFSSKNVVEKFLNGDKGTQGIL